MNDEDFTMLVEKVDIDGEGTVDYTEFAYEICLLPCRSFLLPVDVHD